MKATAAVLVSLAVKAFASPAVYQVVKNAIDNGNAADMEFIGPVTPGGPDVILYGTAKEIYHQVIELNPSYNAWDFPDYAASLAADGFTPADLVIADISVNHQIAARNTLINAAKIECEKPGQIPDPASKDKCGEGIKYLRSLNGKCGTGAKECKRVSCSNNCAIKLCSKISKKVEVQCKDIANDVEAIIDECIDNEKHASGKMNFGTHEIELKTATC